MDKKYQIVRKAETGEIYNRQITAVATATLVTVGVVSLCAIFSKGNSQNYRYNINNSLPYAEQLENMLDINLDSDLEESVNKLQNISILIDEYQNNEGFLVRSHACESLAQNYSEIENTSLEVLKKVIAGEHGGVASEYQIGYEKSDNSWIASNHAVGAITLTGEERSLAEAIGQFQNYQSVDFENLDIRGISQYVQACSQVLDNSISLVTSKSEKFQYVKKP